MTFPVTVILCIRILPMSSLATTPSPLAAASPSAAFMETPVSFSVSDLLTTAPMAPVPSSMTIFILRSGTPSTCPWAVQTPFRMDLLHWGHLLMTPRFSWGMPFHERMYAFLAQIVSPTLSSKSCHAEYWIFPVSSAMSPEYTVLGSPLTVIFLASVERICPVTVTLPIPSRMSPILHSCDEREKVRSGTSRLTPGAGSTLPRLPRLIWTLSFQSLQ